MGASAPGESGSGIASDNEPLSVEGTTFMSYAGPVFPLTLAEETSALTAERETTWDFAPGTYQDGSRNAPAVGGVGDGQLYVS